MFSIFDGIADPVEDTLTARPSPSLLLARDAAALASQRASCPCGGCDDAAARLASGQPTAATFLQPCRVEDAASAAVILPARDARGALLLGSFDGALNAELHAVLLEDGARVSLVVQCAYEKAAESAQLRARGVHVLQLWMDDAAHFPGAPAALFPPPPHVTDGGSDATDLLCRLPVVLPRIAAERAAGRHVFVNCAMGRSRSAAVVLAHLMHAEGHSLASAFHLVRRARPCVAPNAGFLFQLLRMERGAAREASVSVDALARACRPFGDAGAVSAALQAYVGSCAPFDAADCGALPPAAARRLFRSALHSGSTANFCSGAVQANLLVVPSALADDFEAFCRANAVACPLLERLAPGETRSRLLAPGSDLRRDLPRYRVLRADGAADCESLEGAWRDDDTAFLLGCSFSLERALADAGIPVRHVEERRCVPMYVTAVQTAARGPFRGPLVVSMRPMRRDAVERAREATRDLWFGHGAPLQAGAFGLGIADLARPDFGDAVTVHDDEVPVFWACGVTSQLAVRHALQTGALDRALAHAPGCMLVSDFAGDALLKQMPSPRYLAAVAPPPPQHVFVYGSLMRGEVNYPRLGAKMAGCEFVTTAATTVPGYLLHNRSFPYLTFCGPSEGLALGFEAAATPVHGEVFAVPHGASLDQLDAFEPEQYERVRVAVACSAGAGGGGGDLECWAYIVTSAKVAAELWDAAKRGGHGHVAFLAGGDWKSRPR